MGDPSACQWCGSIIGFGDCPHCGGPNPLTKARDIPPKLREVLVFGFAYGLARQMAPRFRR